MRKEWIARITIIVGLVLLISIPVIKTVHGSDAIVMHARMAETGGWIPENLTVEVGQPLHLRLTSDDVTHGFAVGQLDSPSVDVMPGKMTDITLVFDKPGKYTFYCTRWCSLNHWRMRGTIDVTGPGSSQPVPAKQPLYAALGLNIDAPHIASVTPVQMPSAWQGALLNRTIPEKYISLDYYRSHAPGELWNDLRSESAFSDLADQQVWDLVAWVWQMNTAPDQIQQGKRLFTANCAACHGSTGAGNGVFAGQLAISTAMGKSASSLADSAQTTGMRTQPPADFTDPAKMLSASPAHLQGKILRGGMGTGMPSWGAIFTEDQTWALVAYLSTFQFNLEVHP